MNLLEPCLYLVVLVSAYLAGSTYVRAQPGSPTAWPVPPATLTLFILLAVTAGSQAIFPVLLPLFERDYGRFLAGDWWRLVTPLFFQDGGVVGSIFNLVTLLLVGRVAEQLWGSGRWLFIFFVAGVLSELVAFVWQPIGAGNSVANFGLAASVSVVCLLRCEQWYVRALAAVTFIAGAFLLVLRDIHGAATLIGALLGLGLLWSPRRTRAA